MNVWPVICWLEPANRSECLTPEEARQGVAQLTSSDELAAHAAESDRAVRLDSVRSVDR